MNRRGWIVFWVVFALYAFTASAALAQAQDDPPAENEEEASGDEAAVQEGDTEAEGDESPFEREDEGGIGIHPSYTLTYDRNRDQATWNHAFRFDYGYTPRISVGTSSSMRKKSSLTADRVSRVRNNSNGIDFRVAEGLTMGLDISRNWSEDKTAGGAESKERLQEGLEIRASYNTVFLDVLDTKITAGAGKEDREYSDVVSKGNTERISASFDFQPIEDLATTFSYAGNLRISDSEQGGFRSRDRNIDENVDATANYNFGENQRINFTVSGHRTEAQYPSGGAQETRTTNDRRVGINTDLEFLDGVKLGIKFSANDAKTTYALDPDRDNRKAGHGLQIVIPKRDLLLGFTGNATIQDDQKRNEFENSQTGTTTKHAVLGGLDRNLGPKSNMSLKGRMELIRYEFDDKVNNTRDRDLLNQAVQMNLSYKPKVVTANLGAEYKRAEQISIIPSAAADNNTRHTYSVRPKFSVKLWRTVKVTQNYNLSADYTLYHTDEERNLLVRTASLITGVHYALMPGIKLDVKHDYNLQDQGGYRKDSEGVNRYAKARETERQRFILTTGYELGSVSVNVIQSYEYKKQWTFEAHERILKYDSSSIDISGDIRASFNIGKKASGSVTLKQTHRSGKRLSENEKKFWNIHADLTYRL